MNESDVCAFRLNQNAQTNIIFDAARTFAKFKTVTTETNNLYTYIGTENGTMIMYPAKPSHITGKENIKYINECRNFDPRYR